MSIIGGDIIITTTNIRSFRSNSHMKFTNLLLHNKASTNRIVIKDYPDVSFHSTEISFYPLILDFATESLRLDDSSYSLFQLVKRRGNNGGTIKWEKTS